MSAADATAPDTGGGTRRVRVNGPVFYPVAILTILFVAAGTVMPARTHAAIDALRGAIVDSVGWFYVAAIAGFMTFVLYLAFSRHGRVKLGPDDSEPEYSYLSWFAMLFSAGMGVGLLFFGAAEPLRHYVDPPTGEAGSAAAAQQALVIALFHWGSHAWAIVLILGLSLAYATYRRGEPFTVRYALRPLIGDHVDGPLGHMVDIFATLGTIFGVATTLGLGVLQADVGLDRLLGTGTGVGVQLLVVAAVTGVAALSVAAGMDKGIKRLSELNIVLALVLMVFVLATGPTAFLLKALIQNTGAYLGAVVPRTLLTYAYEPNPWMRDWTLFYWGWGIAWSPFVGMFIARISRGRTIREFVLGVLLVPAAITFVWVTAFGNTAIWVDRSGIAPLAAMVGSEAMEQALFALLDNLPLAGATSLVATLLVLSYSVTTADSGAVVVDTLTSGDADDTPAWQRIFWAIAIGAIAAMLLFAGGLDAIQTAVTVIALPLGIAMVFLCWGTLRGLQAEARGATEAGDDGGAVTWQQRFAGIMHAHGRAHVLRFLSEVAAPALATMGDQMREAGLTPETQESEERLELVVPHAERGVFRYVVRLRSYRAPSFAWAERRNARRDERLRYRAMAHGGQGEVERDITDHSGEQVLHDLLNSYARFCAPIDREGVEVGVPPLPRGRLS